MQSLDSKQLVVRENFDQIAELKKRKMGSHAKLAWFAVFCLGLIALAHCVPVEVVYTGEGCECPTKLDFLVNVPKVPRALKFPPAQYGYKLDVPAPVQAKAKVSYSFDFTVEEPSPPRPPPQPTKWNLFAKVDRVAINKGDCEDSYAAPSAPSTCRCGQCGASKPLYRYVYKKVPACNCQCGKCKCNLGRRQAYASSTAPLSFAPNAIVVTRPVRAPLPERLNEPMPVSVPLSLASLLAEGDGGASNNNGSGGVSRGGGSGGVVNIRRKRDLHRAFFRPRKFVKERPGRFVKLYRKNLPDERASFFGRDMRSNRTPKKVKRRAKKALFTHQRSRLVKRDIKGEYELLEKEREQMDLTLPEIIQFMPETLQPNFKRGQCYFGCSSRLDPKPTQHNSQEYSGSKESLKPISITFNTSDSIIDNGTETDQESNVAPNDDKDVISNKQNFLNDTDDPDPNVINTSFTKRNAANYNSGTAIKLPPAASAYPISALYMPSFVAKRAYGAQIAPSHFSTNPLYESQRSQPQSKPLSQPQNAYSAPAVASHKDTTATTSSSPSSSYACGELNREYPQSDGVRINFYDPQSSVPDPLDRHATRLQYAGDLETPAVEYRNFADEELAHLGSPKYPVQQISNDQLDKIITEIIYRHPEFIDASAHYGGALVDPEPWQEQETIQFLKKLIDGRLSLWFGQEDEFNPQYSSSYSNPHNEYNYDVPPLQGLLPPLFAY